MLAPQQLAEELFGRACVSTFLQQDVDQTPDLVYGLPEMVIFTSFLHEDLVQMPYVAKAALATLEISGVLRPELPALLPNDSTRNDDSAFGQWLLDFAEATRESMVQPDPVSDEFSWKSVAA